MHGRQHVVLRSAVEALVPAEKPLSCLAERLQIYSIVRTVSGTHQNEEYTVSLAVSKSFFIFLLAGGGLLDKVVCPA